MEEKKTVETTIEDKKITTIVKKELAENKSTSSKIEITPQNINCSLE